MKVEQILSEVENIENFFLNIADQEGVYCLKSIMRLIQNSYEIIVDREVNKNGK